VSTSEETVSRRQDVLFLARAIALRCSVTAEQSNIDFNSS
jgi:hypothetical protein